MGAGTFSVTVTGLNGCSATSSAVTVTSKAMPSTIKIKIVGATTVCEPLSIPLVIDLPSGSTNGFEYQWILNGNPINGATDSTYAAFVSGSYSLSVSDGNNCSKSSTSKVATIKQLPVANFSVTGTTTFCKGGSVVFYAPVISGYSYTWYNNGVSIGSGVSKTIKLSGNYSVVANLGGCKDTSNNSVAVTVNDLPVASIATNDNTIFCLGDSAQLIATPSVNGFNYKWLNGTSIVDSTIVPNYTAFNAGTYKVIIKDSNGCISKLSTSSVKIKTNAIPTASITPLGSTTISATGSVKLNASPSTGVTWQWYKDGVAISGATSKQYLATIDGSYTVAVTKLGCVGTSAAIVVTQTGVKEEAGITNGSVLSFELSAYPNPVSDVLTINVQGIENVDGTIQVMDCNGRLITCLLYTSPSPRD